MCRAGCARCPPTVRASSRASRATRRSPSPGGARGSLRPASATRVGSLRARRYFRGRAGTGMRAPRRRARGLGARLGPAPRSLLKAAPAPRRAVRLGSSLTSPRGLRAGPRPRRPERLCPRSASTSVSPVNRGHGHVVSALLASVSRCSSRLGIFISVASSWRLFARESSSVGILQLGLTGGGGGRVAAAEVTSCLGATAGSWRTKSKYPRGRSGTSAGGWRPAPRGLASGERSREQLPAWRVAVSAARALTLGSPSQHIFLGGECFLACTCLQQDIFNLYSKHILYVFLFIQMLLVLYSFHFYASATYLSSLFFLFDPWYGSILSIFNFCFEIKRKSRPPGALSVGGSWEVGEGPAFAAMGTAAAAAAHRAQTRQSGWHLAARVGGASWAPRGRPPA